MEKDNAEGAEPVPVLGLAQTQVRLCAPTPQWAALYREEEARLREALGDKLLAAEHYGSTSIPGIQAKPILDILAGISRLSDGSRLAAPLAALGYEYAESRANYTSALRQIEKAPTGDRRGLCCFADGRNYMGFFIIGFAIGFMVLWVIGFAMVPFFIIFLCIIICFCVILPCIIGFFIMGLGMVEVWAKTGTTSVATAAMAARLVINFME